jgi:hypothetical protein
VSKTCTFAVHDFVETLSKVVLVAKSKECASKTGLTSKCSIIVSPNYN